MATDIKSETIALRDKAWDAVLVTQEYAFFKALDEAVSAIGGNSLIGGLAASPQKFWLPKPAFNPSTLAAVGVISGVKRISQTDAAAAVLHDAGEPLPIGRLLERVISKGIVFKGNDPLPSFRSALSKDDKLHSVMRNGMYFWWFKDKPLPSGWDETAGPDLLGASAVSYVSNSEEGGGGHGPATT
jgi:hypothetical protein